MTQTVDLHLSDVSISHLQTVLGAPLPTLSTPGLRYTVRTPEYLYATSFSFPTATNRFVNVYTTSWFETPTFGMDYFEFVVDSTVAPRGLEGQYAPTTRAFREPFSEVNFHPIPGPIVAIETYLWTQTYEQDKVREAVQTESVLRFYREDGQQFCIAVDLTTIIGELYLLTQDADIQRFFVTHPLTVSRRLT